MGTELSPWKAHTEGDRVLFAWSQPPFVGGAMLLGIPAPGTAPALPRIVGTDPGWDPDTLGGVTMALFTPGPHGEEG